MRSGIRNSRRSGYTLVELLVVLMIVMLLTVATLPVVMPALNSRRVSEAALLLQAALAGARDAAIRANEPRGIRLLPSPDFPGGTAPLASDRFVSIEPGPDYNEGLITISALPGPAPVPGTYGPLTTADPRLWIVEAKWANPAVGTIPNPPTSWYWNIRRGEKLRLGGSGRTYTIAGPMLTANPEQYINAGLPSSVSAGPSATAEILILVNGQDDDGDGYIDEAFDGIDNDGDGIIDPGFDGVDNDGIKGIDNAEEMFYNASNPSVFSYGEWEPESFVGSQFGTTYVNQPYTISRRPVVSQGAREVSLPGTVYIDLTTWDAPYALSPTGASSPTRPERSRLPVDPATFYVDIMISPNGSVMPQAGLMQLAGGGSTQLMKNAGPYFHFWLTEQDDIVPPLWGTKSAVSSPNPWQIHPTSNTSGTGSYLLPMPSGTSSYTSSPSDLKAERRLVTLNTKTGEIVTNPIEDFNGSDLDTPYRAAQAGSRALP